MAYDTADPDPVYTMLIAFGMRPLTAWCENGRPMLHFVPYRCAAIWHRPKCMPPECY